MQVELLVGKIHSAVVTQCDLRYQGSITIDRDLMEAAGFLLHQRVDIYNINNGQRFSTYVIEGKRGSKTVAVNGAAARLCQEGDKIIIVAYGIFSREEAFKHKPEVLVLNDKNEIIKRGH